MKNPFTEHPKHVGETYFEHMKFATGFGAKMIMGGLACITHAIFPFAFKKTGSNVLLKMCQDFVSRMPKVETRVVDLSQLIEQKRKAQQ